MLLRFMRSTKQKFSNGSRSISPVSPQRILFALAVLFFAYPALPGLLNEPAGAATASERQNHKSRESSPAVRPSKLSEQDASMSGWAGDAESQTQTEKTNEKVSSIFPIKTPDKAGSVKSVTTSDTIKEQFKYLTLDRAQVDLKTIGETIIVLRRKATDNPRNFEIRLKLGTYLYLAGDYEGAIKELQKAISLSTGNPVARCQLSRVLDFVGHHDDALMQLRKAVSLAPNSAEVHLHFAESLMLGGNVSEGINEYRRSIGIEPTAASLSGLAEALLVMSDKVGALKAARHAVSLNPASPRAQVALTNALLQSGDIASSVRTARQASLLNPNIPESHMALGRSLYAKGDVDGAVEEFKRAVSLDPLNARARNDLGFALYGKGDILSAINEFRLALRIDPRLSEARNNLEVAIHRLSGK